MQRNRNKKPKVTFLKGAHAAQPTGVLLSPLAPRPLLPAHHQAAAHCAALTASLSHNNLHALPTSCSIKMLHSHCSSPCLDAPLWRTMILQVQSGTCTGSCTVKPLNRLTRPHMEFPQCDSSFGYATCNLLLSSANYPNCPIQYRFLFYSRFHHYPGMTSINLHLTL